MGRPPVRVALRSQQSLKAGIKANFLAFAVECEPTAARAGLYVEYHWPQQHGHDARFGARREAGISREDEGEAQIPPVDAGVPPERRGMTR
jgi:hypothetical protein